MNFSALASIIHSNIRFSNELSGLLLPLNVEDILRSSLLFAKWKNNGRKKSKMEKEKIWESIDRLKLFLDIGIYLFSLRCRSSISGKMGKEQARGEIWSEIESKLALCILSGFILERVAPPRSSHVSFVFFF